MLTNSKRTMLYVGVTNDMERRILEHKAGIGSKHTSKYNIKYLVYYEEFPSIVDAIAREKQLKNWHKDWKWNLIKETNPNFIDLSVDWFTENDIIQVSDSERS